MKFILENSKFSQLNSLDWQDIKFTRLEREGNLMKLGVILPGEEAPNPEIILTIQIIHNLLYQPHITIGDRLRRRGLAFKIYRALIEKLGHLYSGKRRRLNPIIDRLWAKLRIESNLEGATSSIGDAVWTKENPDGEQIRLFVEDK
jgi:hypothetical protein